ncbi:MAG TPA: acetyl-CoA carboxylase biotin carboxyl carrier protein [Bryobacteraceae bacterium]|jgi:acetyl-CoA carboxylase biotin carboxyl carrier protein
MTIEEIRKLIDVVKETGISELEVQLGENRVKITVHKSTNQEMVVPSMVPIAVTGPVANPVVPAAVPHAAPAAEPASVESPGDKEDERTVLVKSPIVGTYYDAPTPGAPSFVKVGDRVEPKQVLCIIESMKLMNEIEAEIAGTVVAKHVENGRPVEYGESLFTIRPI